MSIRLAPLIVLAGHEDMLTTLEGPVTLRLSEGKTQEISSRSGVISCHAGQVIICLGVDALCGVSQTQYRQNP